MEEYVLDNGRIKLGPNCIGAAEFTDGHFEPVVNVEFLTKSHFRFITQSGVYSYKVRLEEQELLYCDPSPTVFYHTKYEFAKFDLNTLEWYIVDTIKQVLLYAPAFPILNEEEE